MRAADGHIGKQESDRISAANAPFVNLFWRFSALQKAPEIFGQCTELKADRIRRHAHAERTRPVDRLFAFLFIHSSVVKMSQKPSLYDTPKISIQ